MSRNKAKRLGFQAKGQKTVVAAKAPKPFVSLLDFAEHEAKKKSAAIRLEGLKKDLESVMCLPGTGIWGSQNWRAKTNIVAEIAECRKILETNGAK